MYQYEDEHNLLSLVLQVPTSEMSASTSSMVPLKVPAGRRLPLGLLGSDAEGDSIGLFTFTRCNETDGFTCWSGQCIDIT